MEMDPMFKNTCDLIVYVEHRGDIDRIVGAARRYVMRAMHVVVTSSDSSVFRAHTDICTLSALRHLWRLWTTVGVDRISIDLQMVPGTLGFSHLFPLSLVDRTPAAKVVCTKLLLVFSRIHLHQVGPWGVQWNVQDLGLIGDVHTDQQLVLPLRQLRRLSMELNPWGGTMVWFRPFCDQIWDGLQFLDVDLDVSAVELDAFFQTLKGFSQLQRLCLQMTLLLTDIAHFPLFPSLPHVRRVQCSVEFGTVPVYLIHNWLSRVFGVRCTIAPIVLLLSHCPSNIVYDEPVLFRIGHAWTNDEQLAFVLNYQCFNNHERVITQTRKKPS